MASCKHKTPWSVNDEYFVRNVLSFTQARTHEAKLIEDPPGLFHEKKNS